MSLRALALDNLLKRVLPRSGTDAAAELARRRRAGVPPPAAVPTGLRRHFRINRRNVADAEVVTIAHPNPPDRVLVYLPGGGYAHPISANHWRVIGRLGRAAGVDTIVPLYQVAPAGNAKQAHRLVATVLDQAADRYRRITIAGDSAGGGLALAALQRHPDRIHAAVLLNPWLDVEITNPAALAVQDWDVILRIDELRQWGAAWADTLDTADPAVSPIRGPLHDLPPVHMITGGRDLLMPDALELHRLLRLADNPGELHYNPDGNHAVGLTVTATPEAKQAHRAMLRWMQS